MRGGVSGEFVFGGESCSREEGREKERERVCEMHVCDVLTDMHTHTHTLCAGE